MDALIHSEGASLIDSFGLEARDVSGVGALEPAIEAWLRMLAPELSRGPTLALGRIAWLRCGGPGQWRAQFLAPSPSADFIAAFRAALPCPTPEAAPLGMPAQALRVRRARSRRVAGRSRLVAPGGRPEAAG